MREVHIARPVGERPAIVTATHLSNQQAATPRLPKPPQPLFKLPAGSTNGTKLDAFVNASKLAFPAGPQVDVPLNPAYGPVAAPDGANAGPVLPWSDPRINKTVPGCAPEQVHLSWYATPDSRGPSVLVSWATCDSAYYWQGAAANTPAAPLDTSAATSKVLVGAVPGLYDKEFDGTSYSYVFDSTKYLNGSNAGGGSYVSPILHHTLLTGLIPGVTCFYKIENAPQLPGGTLQGAPFFGQFRVPGGFPTRLAVGADSGEVSNVTANIDFTISQKPDAFLMNGDWTYANKYDLDTASCFTPQQCATLAAAGVTTFSPRWDAYSRLFQPLMASTVVLGAVGNHELETTPVNGEIPFEGNAWNNNLFFTRFTNYLARFPNPSTPEIARAGPTAADLAPITPTTDQGKGLFYVTELPGVATTIVLSTYVYTDQYLPSDPQYVWLQGVLARVDRVKTPWLIVSMHAGFYALSQMFVQVECMRQLYEPLFRAYSVDIVFIGHSHDYERAGPMYDWQSDRQCGMTYIGVGSYGPNEGVTTFWVDQWPNPAVAPTYPSCPNQPTLFNPNSGATPFATTAPGQWGAGGRCIAPKLAAAGGEWCPSSQPSWSRWCQHAFGSGTLDILSPTKAVWAFYSQESDSLFKPVDEIVITRADPAKCASTPATVAAAATVGVAMSDVLAASKTFNLTAAQAFLSGKAHGGAVSIDPKGTAAGVAAAGAAFVGAKLGLVNFTANAVAAQLANKTGVGR